MKHLKKFNENNSDFIKDIEVEIRLKNNLEAALSIVSSNPFHEKKSFHKDARKLLTEIEIFVHTWSDKDNQINKDYPYRDIGRNRFA